MKSQLTQRITRARIQASSKGYLRLRYPLMPRSGSWWLVSEILVEHIDSMFRDQAIQVDSRLQLNV